MRVYVATTNFGKLTEFRTLLAAHGIDAALYEAYAAPEEGANSYEENAALKARALQAQLQAIGQSAVVVADDSGLEVDALGGGPGVVTALYGGVGISWAERRANLLRELRYVPQDERGARFVAVVHVIDATGAERSARGEVSGYIPHEERGEGGFSFDAVFWYPPSRRTFAEMSASEKNSVSHRARAITALFGVRADA